MSIPKKCLYYGVGAIGSGYILKNTYFWPFFGFAYGSLTADTIDPEKVNRRAIGFGILFAIPAVFSSYGLVHFSRRFVREWKKVV